MTLLASAAPAGRNHTASNADPDIDFEIERLLEAFLADELAASRLSHRRQVQLAWVLLRHTDFACALQVFSRSMQRRSARAGVAFNVTVTTTLVRVVADALAETGAGACWRAFERDNPHLMDPELLQHWYPAGRLSDRAARAQFAAPAGPDRADA